MPGPQRRRATDPAGGPFNTRPGVTDSPLAWLGIGLLVLLILAGAALLFARSRRG